PVKVLIVIKWIELVPNHHRIFNHRAPVGVVAKLFVERRYFAGANDNVQGESWRREIAVKRMAPVNLSVVMLISTMVGKIIWGGIALRQWTCQRQNNHTGKRQDALQSRPKLDA